MVEANEESFRNLEENCVENGINLAETALVLQFNKRDLPAVSSVEEMNNSLNRYNAPFYESVATTGIGVHETLKGITKLVLHSLRERYAGERPASRSASVTAPAVSPAESKAPGGTAEVPGALSPAGSAPPVRTPPVLAEPSRAASIPVSPVEPMPVSASIEAPAASTAEGFLSERGADDGGGFGPSTTGQDPFGAMDTGPGDALQDEVQTGVTVAPHAVSETEAGAEESEFFLPDVQPTDLPEEGLAEDERAPSGMTVQSAMPDGGPFEADEDDEEIEVLDLDGAVGEEESWTPLSAEPKLPELTP
jgi:hypothetical protein